MDEFDEEAERKFMDNFKLLKDKVDTSGVVTEKNSIPHDTKPGELPKVVRDAIGELDVAAVNALNKLAGDTDTHILVHERGNQRGKIIAMGL